MNQEDKTLSGASFLGHDWRWWLCRVLAGAVGLIFLAAGLLKATDIELFIRQIRDYGLVSHSLLLALGAWGMIILEVALGAALILFYRPKQTLPMMEMLLFAFLMLNGWAWLTDATEDCGCFGTWFKRSPAEGFLEGLIFIAAVSVAWLGQRKIRIPEHRAKIWIVAAVCILGAVLPVASGYRITQVNRPHAENVENRLGQLQIEGLENVDLSSGSYLITLFDTDCGHCQEAVLELNDIADTEGLPDLIGLCTNDEQQRAGFVSAFEPVFPIGRINKEDFWRLLGDGDIPRIILVRDRQVKQVWDRDILAEDIIEAVRAQ